MYLSVCKVFFVLFVVNYEFDIAIIDVSAQLENPIVAHLCRNSVNEFAIDHLNDILLSTDDSTLFSTCKTNDN